MDSNALWKKFYRFQEKSGYCGPAVVEMILEAAGLKTTQDKIARDIYHDWWGTNHESMFSYLSKYFDEYGMKENSSTDEILRLTDRNRAVIVNWYDDLNLSDSADGHYSIVASIDKKKDVITLVDPSRTRRGIWQFGLRQFESRWFDYLDVGKKIKIEKWLLWVNLKSVVKLAGKRA